MEDYECKGFLYEKKTMSKSSLTSVLTLSKSLQKDFPSNEIPKYILSGVTILKTCWFQNFLWHNPIYGVLFVSMKWIVQTIKQGVVW